ncbi:hypothetical protein [Bradyrhizobium cenepequi]
MRNSIVAIFPDQAKADECVRAIEELEAHGNIKFYGSALVRRDESGKLSVAEITKEGHGGTIVGALIGALAGLPAGPLGVTIAAVGGATVGLSADLIHENDQMKLAETISQELGRGKVGVVAEVAEDGVTILKARIKAIGGTVVAQ